MADDVNVPKLGKMNKKIVLPIVGVAAAYVGYRYYKSRQAAALPVDSPAYQDAGTIPGVSGAVNPNNAYGGTTGGTGGDGNNQITTNAQWSQYAIGQLSQSGRWDPADIASALGNFLTDQPLADAQQTIVRAAIGVAGYPPVGSHAVIPGGNTSLSIAPSGVSVSGITGTTAMVNFLPVSGAKTYNVYRSGSSSPVGTSSSTPISIQGLTPATKYTVQVAGVSASGAVGPKSSAVSFTTASATAVQPSQPHLGTVTKDRATLSTSISSSTGIIGYRWNLNGRLANQTTGNVVTLTNLSPNTSYSVTVQSVTNSGKTSHVSTAKSFRTARK